MKGRLYQEEDDVAFSYLATRGRSLWPDQRWGCNLRSAMGAYDYSCSGVALNPVDNLNVEPFQLMATYSVVARASGTATESLASMAQSFPGLPVPCSTTTWVCCRSSRGRAPCQKPQGLGEKDLTVEAGEGEIDLKEQNMRVTQHDGGGLCLCFLLATSTTWGEVSCWHSSPALNSALASSADVRLLRSCSRHAMK